MKNSVWAALSGGMDSVVLLHFLKSCFPEWDIQAVHVNHRLSDQAEDFERRCKKICALLKTPLTILSVNIRKTPAQSLEAQARAARYGAFKKILKKNQLLFTAHHQDDQAETFLLQLLRGGGLRGVSAMRCVSFLNLTAQHKSDQKNTAFLVRPLLSFSRQDLRNYADFHCLSWIEDASNKNLNFDRNYLRHEILPALKKRWPAVLKTFTRFSAHCKAQEDLLKILAEQDYQCCEKIFNHRICMHIPAFVQFSNPARQKNILRFYFEKNNFILPSEKILDQILRMTTAQKDKNPCVSWPNAQCRRYQQGLYILLPPKSRSPDLTPAEIVWAQQNLPENLYLASKITFRKGGEKFKPKNSRHTQTLKNLFNQWKIPPWERNFVPLLYYQEKLIAIVGYSANYPQEIEPAA